MDRGGLTAIDVIVNPSFWIVLGMGFVGGTTAELARSFWHKDFDLYRAVTGGLISVYLLAIIGVVFRNLRVGEDIALIIILGCTLFPLDIMKLIKKAVSKITSNGKK